MRIALIGDLQYWMPYEEQLDFKMKQVAGVKPDFAVMMGDFGGSKMRNPDGYRETKEHLDLIGCPYQVIFGNHDVEYASDYCNDFDPAATCREIFGIEPYGSYIMNGVLVLCVTIERQPLEDMRTIHAVYVSNEQFSWIEDQLCSHPDMPTILITHAPMAGSGIRCDRPLHCAALDTYIDQTYDFGRWQDLLCRFPQIKVWCSAHYHLGHDYDTAITEKDGVIHISCGVMTCCSRDESKHTRILDINDQKQLIVSTLDHNNDEKLHTDATIDLTGNTPHCGRIAQVVYGEMLLGEDHPERVWFLEEKQRYYISTANGLLWEYLCKYDEFGGAICLERKVDSLSADSERLYIKYQDGEIVSVELDSRMRWDWDNLRSQESRTEDKLSGRILPTVGFTTREAKEGTYVKFIND